jgi:hypothetical protein
MGNAAWNFFQILGFLAGKKYINRNDVHLNLYGADKMLFFWVILFVAAFLGTIALVFYLTLKLNEMEKFVNELSEIVKVCYAIPTDTTGKKK